MQRDKVLQVIWSLFKMGVVWKRHIDHIKSLNHDPVGDRSPANAVEVDDSPNDEDPNLHLLWTLELLMSYHQSLWMEAYVLLQEVVLFSLVPMVNPSRSRQPPQGYGQGVTLISTLD